MARRFRGEGRQKVDGKGRVSIPALFRRVVEAADPDWREGLRPQLIIVYGDPRRRFLECYTIEAMDEVDTEIDALPRGSRKRRVLELEVQGKSFPTEIDPDGRLVLPKMLRDKAELQGEAYFIASGDTFQIWNPEVFEEDRVARTRSLLEELPEDADILSLLDEPDGA